MSFCNSFRRDTLGGLPDMMPCSLGRPGNIEAYPDQFGDICFAHAHDRVCSTPVDVYSSIGLRNSATREDYVVDISGYFPRILRLQNPRVAYSDHFCRVLEVMKSNPQTID